MNLTKKFQLKFKQNEKCRTVCSKKYESKPEDIEKLQFLMHGMYFSYENRWLVFICLNFLL